MHFLKDQLGLSETELELAMERCDQPSNLPMVLYQYGLVTLPQLDDLWDWMFAR